MSDTGITSETRAAPVRSRRRAMNFALWALLGGLGRLRRGFEAIPTRRAGAKSRR